MLSISYFLLRGTLIETLKSSKVIRLVKLLSMLYSVIDILCVIKQHILYQHNFALVARKITKHKELTFHMDFKLLIVIITITDVSIRQKFFSFISHHCIVFVRKFTFFICRPIYC